LNGFQFLTSVPMDMQLAETRKTTAMQEKRAQSVITARYEDEIRRKIKANESRRKLDKVLYRAKDELKKAIKTDFRATHNTRCTEIQDK
jgi:hypothetical protein